jgi:hypothetical protein
VIFEGSDGSFGCVGSVVVRWKQLKLDILFAQVISENVRAFIVQAVELRTETGFGESVFDLLKCLQNICG